MNPFKLFYEGIKEFLAALLADNFARVTILLSILVGASMWYFGREDKEISEQARKLAEEICRQDRLKTDSTNRAQLVYWHQYYGAKLDAKDQELINTLRAITGQVKGAVAELKEKDEVRVLQNAEVNRKVNRNGAELEAIKQQKLQQ